MSKSTIFHVRLEPEKLAELQESFRDFVTTYDLEISFSQYIRSLIERGHSLKPRRDLKEFEEALRSNYKFNEDQVQSLMFDIKLLLRLSK